MSEKLLQKVYWADVRKLVRSVNEKLADAIDALSPGKNYPIYLAKYSFGQHILKKSEFMLPGAPSPVSINDTSVASDLKNDLGYNRTIPMGIVLKNRLEQCIPLHDRIIPYNCFEEGGIFALWTALDPEITLHAAKVWNIVSGTRSMFLLPKISDEVSFRKLKREFKIKSPTPRSLESQWEVFKEIASSSQFSEKWFSEVLFFSKSWLDHKEDLSSDWQNFYKFLYKTVWDGSQFQRNSVIFNFIFSRAQSSKNLRPNPYLADVVKHLLAMSMGATVGFGVANDNKSGPVYEFEKVFTDVYGLRNNYAATFLCPYYYSERKKNVVYYSLRYPVALEFSPRSRNLSSTLKDLVEVKHILDTLKDNLLLQQDLSDTTVFRSLQAVDFKCFHSEPDSLGEILSSSLIEDLDSAFKMCQSRQLDRSFCENSPFLKGCIAILQKSHI